METTHMGLEIMINIIALGSILFVLLISEYRNKEKA